MSKLVADREQIARFVGALFKHADPDSFVSLRAFTHKDDRPVGMCDGKFPCVRLGGNDLIGRATRAAAYVASYPEPAVFCPPVAAFTNDRHARGEDLANGLVLSVECDQRPEAARTKLEALLGPATIVMASGGRWTNPESGRVEDKLHLHWRLREPTRDPAAHERLRFTRRLATTLVGGDASNIHMVHPLRWAGSWHTKIPESPRLAQIVAETENEIKLDGALYALDGAGKWQGAAPILTAQPDEHWLALADGVDQGTTGRINAVISIFGLLLRCQAIHPCIAVALAHDYNLGHCRPPLPWKKVDDALRSIMRRESGRE